ncbi:MAG TPA: nuclear transport factor 2 family protein [Polyangiaceae bacterium]|jgi:hypothetical protein
MKIRSLAGVGALALSLLLVPVVSRGSPPARNTSEVGPELQQEISQVLWGCFAEGADLVGVGNVPAATDVLQHCFTGDMTFDAVMPAAYSKLNFSTSGGAAGFVAGANGVYRSMGIVRVQHLITNVVITRTGPDTAVVNSGALAIHTYGDEHVFNANVKFVDQFQRVDGVWMITHRTMNVISVSQAAAWAPQ